MITGTKIRLRKKKLSDARNDYTWQSTSELAKLDAAPVLTMPFSQYIIDYISELQFPTPDRRVFAIETLDGRHIGNCVYYHIDSVKGEAEIGIMLGDRAFWDKGYGTDAIKTLVDYIFTHTRLNRLYLKTLDWNKRAQRTFAKCGFTPCGQMTRNEYNFILMELLRHQWAEKKRLETASAVDG
jgi:RimJ/RimL family protein N-acetyltransferase